jgi:hypothetical protein
MGTFFKEYAYPLNNYNYNYKTYVDNNYSISKMGVSSNSTLGQFKTNINALSHFTKPLILDPIPTANSVAGVSDIDYSNKEAVEKAQQGFRQQPPYNRFRFEYPERDYPTTGIYSSSYFVQSGFCPVVLSLPNPSKVFFKSPNTKKDDQGGSCFKPRYSYINNASDNGLTDGLIPGVVGDIIDMNPGNFLRTMEGNAIPGSTDTSPPRFQLLPCITEHFDGNTVENKYKWFHFAAISFIIVFIYVLLHR